MRIHYIFLGLLLGILSGCASSRLVNQWKSPDTPVFEANKVLVIGMTANIDSRRMFEDELVTRLEKEGVIAVKSVDFFDTSFTNAERTEAELNTIENQLLQAGFDAVLISKVIGSEDRTTLVGSINAFRKDMGSFREYYYENQRIYSEAQQSSSYKVYHTETSLFCLCPGKERELLWKGMIDVVDPQRPQRAVADYARILMKEMEQQQMLLVAN
ncbi:hypothetical protein [Altibacter sp.]|uniref:hypothetical protein n=1 Tax=Altibacter sp. TaxID=2024823 RepID=UPI002590197D|nr:hypothetical protein [Altibacter sp.]MCW8981298.1 hypothetical protein [Altibacter sp.]MCW9037311.1 hypothetical protein [Altibacter sp.]